VIFRWMLPGIDHPARAALLNGVRQGAPREVFEGVLAIAQAHLGRRDCKIVHVQQLRRRRTDEDRRVQGRQRRAEGITDW
jgi:hypothetical protein